jgi:predicted NBD/HSP70 family sugar kinase
LGKPVTIDEVVQLGRAGKPDLSADFDDVAQFLAIRVAAVINLFYPTRLFAHGRMFEADDLLVGMTSAVAPTFETNTPCFPTEVHHALPAT